MLLALAAFLALATAPADTLIDTRVDVGGRALHVVVRPGTVPVTIVLEAGGGADLTSWETVPGALARATGATIVAYDRASLGASDPAPADLSPRQEVDDLRTALDALGVPGPRILVAASYGAMLALLHAAAHPDDVAALVLVDPMNSRFVEATGDFIYSTVPDVADPRSERDRVVVRTKRTFPDLVREVRAAEPGLGQPMVVLTAGEAWWGRPDVDAAWRASHKAMVAGHSGRSLVVAAGSRHRIPEHRPDLIVDAAIGLLGRVPFRRPAGTAAGGDPGGDLVAVFDTLVPRVLAEHAAPGAAVALVEDGRVVAARGYGRADALSGRPMTATTPIHVASVAKSVTAWGVLRLVREGALELDAPIDRVLRRWHVPPGAFDAEGVTARRLLSHTAGIGQPSVPWFPIEREAPPLEAVLEGRLGPGGAVRIERAPGQGWGYSGGGYTILQLAAEETSGRPFEAFMRDAVLEPLGMDATTYAPPASGDAVGHDERGGPVPFRQFVGAAAAGLQTTAEDMARLLVAYHEAWTGDGEPVLEREQIRLAAEPVAPVALPNVQGAAYGLGHATHRTPDGRTLLYHSGGNPGYRAYLLVDPAAGDGLFVAVNSDHGIPVIMQLREVWGRRHGGGLPPLF